MTTEQIVWDVLIKEIKNPYGVAGVMGNLMAESSMNPLCATGKGIISGSDYVEKIKSGEIDAETFAHDGVAFGLAQWRYWSRKESLIKFTSERMVGNASMQSMFLVDELKTYKTVWATLLSAKSVKEASDIVMLKYEKPANTGDAAKEKRAAYGQEYYDKFIGSVKTKMVRTTADQVNIRRGNGKAYAAVGRANKSGEEYEWVATAENGWHAIKWKIPNMVAWVSGEFAEVIDG